MTHPTKSELIEAGQVLMRLRGYAFPIKEAEHGQPGNIQILPSATEISKCLAWGATCLHREATRIDGGVK